MLPASKLECALLLAEKGFYVFRLASNSKKPIAGIPWQQSSTRDPEKIREMWTDQALGWQTDDNIAIDCEKSGLFVVDVDCKEGKLGKETYETLSQIHGDWPATLTSITVSGGRHHIYIENGTRNTQGKLGSGIDTRGIGGFIVAPGSSLDGKTYDWLDNGTDRPCAAPDWIKEVLQSATQHTGVSQAATVISADADIDIEAAIAFLKKQPPAVQGDAGDAHTFQTVCLLKDIGLSPQMACDLLEEHWNPNCSPPWDHSELVVKVKSAYKSAQNATGVRSATEFEGIYTGEAPAKAVPQIHFLTPFADFETAAIPPRQHVFGDLAYRKILTMLVAPGGQGKSTFTLMMAVSKATGVNLLGIDPGEAGRVAMWNNEDDMDEIRRRIAAICERYNIDRKRLAGQLFINSGEDRRLRMAQRVNGLIKPQDAQAMIDSIRHNQIDLMIIDPFSETHPAQENSNEEILEVGCIYRNVAQLTHCAVVGVHHTRKLDSASSEGHSGNLDSMRGAGSLGGVARVVATLNTMNKNQGKILGIDENKRPFHVVLETAKANLSAPGANFRVYKRVGETINITESNMEGDEVGVLEYVKMDMRTPVKNDSTAQLLAAMASCLESGQKHAAQLADQIVGTFAFYSDKQPDNIAKQIKRLFEDKDTYVLDNGEISSSRVTAVRGKPSLFFRFTDKVTSVSELL